MLDLSFSKPDEIVKRLCERLRMERLAQEMTQADVASRAGIGGIGPCAVTLAEAEGLPAHARSIEVRLGI